MIFESILAVGLASSSLSNPSPASDAIYDSPAHIVLPDGRGLAIYCRGEGTPTVIFESGLGMGASVWKQVQPAISWETRSCSYDRAGYGHSDPGPHPRDARHSVADLRAVLSAAAIRPPYVLVGHSSGAWSMRLFAKLYPSEVAGMVLVEPSIDEQKLRAVSPAFVRALADEDAQAGKCIRATAAGQMKPGNRIYTACGSPPLNSPISKPSLAQTVLSEQTSEPMSLAEVSAGEVGYGAKPLIVMTGGAQFSNGSGFPPGASASELGALQTAWREGHAKIAKLSSSGSQRIVEGASHVIHLAKPQAVIEAIEEVIGESRR